MNRKDHDVLSAILDGEAEERDVQKFLAQAHDPEIEARWRAICRQRDLSHEDSADWANQDLRKGMWAALEEESPQSLSLEEAQALPEGGEISRESDVSGSLPWWASLAVAASVMGLVVVGVATPFGGQSTAPSVADTGPKEGPAWVASPAIEAQTLSATEKEAYESRVQALLLQHTGNASLSLSPGPETLARLTSYSQPPASVGESGESLGSPLSEKSAEGQAKEVSPE